MAKRVKEVDPETLKIEKTGKAIKDLVGSPGWAEAKLRLIKKIAQLKIISTDILQSDPTTIMSVIAAKDMAANILLEWFHDIEGTAEQHDSNAGLIEKSIEGLVMQIEE